MRNFSSLQILVMAVSFSAAPACLAAGLMPAPQEDTLVLQYCGSCHSDALMYGGLTVQHFDAAHPDPTLAAMLLNKLTRGHTPADVLASASPDILNMMKASAMGAAGKGVPDEETQVALSRALAEQSKGAYGWNTAWDAAPGAPNRTLVASLLKEKPSVQRPGASDSYRLIVSCRTGTRAGEIKIAWADFPAQEGQIMSVSVDSGPAVQHRVEGGRAQGNAFGPGATTLNIPLPTQTLTIGSLFSDGAIQFPLKDLDPGVRRDLAVCFSGNTGAP